MSEPSAIDPNKPRHKPCMEEDQCCRCDRPGGAEVVIEHDDGVLHGYCRSCAQAVLAPRQP